MSDFFRKVLYMILIPGIPLLGICISGGEGILIAGLLGLALIGIYILVAIILLVMANSEWAKVLFLSAGIILLIGASTCGIIMGGL
jgi:hypothetical protein